MPLMQDTAARRPARPDRPHNVPTEPLGAPGDGWPLVEPLLDRAKEFQGPPSQSPTTGRSLGAPNEMMRSGAPNVLLLRRKKVFVLGR